MNFDAPQTTMSMPRVIKTEAQYQEYLREAEALAAEDPHPSSADGERLELLSVLIENYETERTSVCYPSPLDAILFRMEQQGLQQKDLTPYLGCKSKVSEVLSGQRSLSLNMIRKLSNGLGIPAEVLIQEPKAKPHTKGGAVTPELGGDQLQLYPVKEMLRRGWLGELTARDAGSLQGALQAFLDSVTGEGIGPAFCRRATHFGGDVSTDQYAINAWVARVLVKSRDHRESVGRFIMPRDALDFLTPIAKLSGLDAGPMLAMEYLRKRGIVLVIEPHLPRTRLDGAAVLDRDRTPVVGMTLRYDRVDNFWFTLMHELAHVVRHIHSTGDLYMDNTYDGPEEVEQEREADFLAQEALVPRSKWRRSRAYRTHTVDAIAELANELGIHPAIVAGRIQRDTGNYRKFSRLVHDSKIRRHFPEFALDNRLGKRDEQ
jgi:HTH-type transcriptional regulator / antitoxin HigA